MINFKGKVKLHSIKLTGLTNISRNDSVVIEMLSEKQNRVWMLTTELLIRNIKSEFKVDAELLNRIFIKEWQLESNIKSISLKLRIEFDLIDKMLNINSLNVKSINGFNLKSEQLSWPFNEILTQILNNQSKLFKEIISKNAQIYMEKALMMIDVKDIIKRLKL